MRHFRPILILAAVLALIAAGCGGSSGKVPSDAVATVNGQPIKKAALEQLMTQAKVTYANQKRPFPKAGSTEYAALQTQAITYLVQRSQFAQEAGKMGIKVTDSQVNARLAAIKKQYFSNDPKKYAAQLKSQGLTDAQVRDDLRAQLVSEAIFNKVAAKATVSDAAIAAYYAKNKAQYSKPETRDVRPAQTTPLKDVKDTIRQQLLQTSKNAAMTAWVANVKKKYDAKTHFQVGYGPATTATTTT